MGTYEHRILVTIDVETFHRQVVSTGFTLRPEALLGARKERDAALSLRFMPRLGIKVAKHEHLPGSRILHNGGNKLVRHLLKI
jgi:hypothetical protein